MYGPFKGPAEIQKIVEKINYLTTQQICSQGDSCGGFYAKQWFNEDMIKKRRD